MTRPKNRSTTVINSTNYDMEFSGQEDVGGTLCDVLELTPKRRGPHVLKGRLWVDAESKRTLRIEGKPPVSASFLAGRPNMVLEFAPDVKGYSMIRHSHAVSSTLLLGTTEVDVEFRDYQVEVLH